ncbi:hypothetical protein AHiyo6_05060 [Arthrobacter sp. Hiyo6]|nr:hypothetical protein AHiyo6_05060 [Arthrobacter sp. Hiyo6]
MSTLQLENAVQNGERNKKAAHQSAQGKDIVASGHGYLQDASSRSTPPRYRHGLTSATKVRSPMDCSPPYPRVARLSKTAGAWRRVLSSQRRNHNNGGGDGQRGQAHVREHLEAPPPELTAGVPGTQSTRIVPHGQDGTGTGWEESQAVRFMTNLLVGPPSGVTQGRGKTSPWFGRHVLLVKPRADGVGIIGNDVPCHEAADGFSNGGYHAPTLRAAGSQSQSSQYLSIWVPTTRVWGHRVLASYPTAVSAPCTAGISLLFLPQTGSKICSSKQSAKAFASVSLLQSL